MDQAAQEGDIDALYEQIQIDPNILGSIEKMPFVDTPLHAAALFGHTDFAIEIMRLQPSFAKKLNQHGFSPLHLALQNGHSQMICRLLDVDGDLVRVKGREGITPLHYVAEEGNVDLLAMFLSVSPQSLEDVTIRNETAMHLALKNDKFEAFEMLLRCLECISHKEAYYWKNRIINWKDKDGNTLLHLATSKNQPKAVRYLLNKADVNVKNFDGLTALDIIHGQTELGNGEIKNMLYSVGALGGASSLPIIDSFAHFLRADRRLDKVAQRGDVDALYILLREDGYLLERIDEVPFVNTPLHIAASAGHIKFALEMIRLKPSFARKQNQDGYSPLHLALQCGKIKLVERLIDVDRNLVRFQGREGKSSLHYAAEKGNVTLLTKFLTSCPESILDVTNRKETALHLAAKNGQLKALKALMGWLEYIDKKMIVEWIDSKGNTLLHNAVSRPDVQIEMVRLLIRKGVPINAKNSKNVTVLDIYEEKQHQVEEIRDILRKAHAKMGSSVSSMSIEKALQNEKISPMKWAILYICRIKQFMTNEDRNAILVVAVLIATATYQAALTSDDSPPYISHIIFCYTYAWAFLASMAMIYNLLPRVGNGILVYPLVISFTMLNFWVPADRPILQFICVSCLLFWIISSFINNLFHRPFVREVLRPIFKHYRSFRSEMVARAELHEVQR